MYKTVQDLPSTLRATLPPAAQTLYLETYNRVWNEQQNLDENWRGQVAHRLAWDAMTREFTFDDSADHQGSAWHRNGETAAAEKPAKRGLLARLGLR